VFISLLHLTAEKKKEGTAMKMGPCFPDPFYLLLAAVVNCAAKALHLKSRELAFG